MIIRAATPDDADHIATIWNAEIRHGVSTFTSQEKAVSDIVQLIEHDRDGFCVVQNADHQLGFGRLSQFRSGDGYAHSMEHSIYVAPQAQGMGVGRNIMAYLEDVATNRGARSLIAGIGAENTAAIAFHTHLGFRTVGRVQDAGRKFDRWMDLVLMQKIL